MRVLMITGSLPPMRCGVGDSMVILASEIALIENTVVGVLSSTGAGKIDSERVEVLPIVKTWGIREGWSLLKVIRGWKPDIVHIQYPSLGYGKGMLPYFLPLLLKYAGFPVVQTWHEPPSRFCYSPNLRARFLRYIRGFRYLPAALTKDIVITVEPDSLSNLRIPYGWLIRRKTIRHIPVASNIPRVELSEMECSEIRERYVGQGRKMVVSFGFAFPNKGLEFLFEVANPDRDTLVLIMTLDPEGNAYHRRLMELVEAGRWKGKVVVTGFLETNQVAELLGAAEAAVFPFRSGVAPRNGSFMAARAQGTFTITTSSERQGFDLLENVYYAPLNDVESMRNALSAHLDSSSGKQPSKVIGWPEIAVSHAGLYKDYLGVDRKPTSAELSL